MEKEVIDKYLEAGRIGKLALEHAKTLAGPDALLLDIANDVEKLIRDNNAMPAFPLNLSINNEAAHYTPLAGDRKKLKRGDLLKIDIGAHIDGYMSDNAATVEVGETGNYTDLIESTRSALNKAVSVVRPMQRIGEIGRVIGATIESYGFKPVKNLGGHGINRYDLHSSIFIPNYNDGNAQQLSPGIAIAIEPFASTGIGMIHNGPGGNIYILSGTKIRKDEPIYQNFRTAPFAGRWLEGIVPDHEKYLKKMMKSREVSHFPVLKEHVNSRIAQSEHTLLVLPDRVIVTTK